MTHHRIVSAIAATLLLFTAGAGTAVAAPITHAAKEYKNCTALREDYPHGVGKTGATDKVRGTTEPVTDFKVSNKLYQANKKSDRDKDGVACEQQ